MVLLGPGCDRLEGGVKDIGEMGYVQGFVGVRVRDGNVVGVGGACLGRVGAVGREKVVQGGG